VANEKFWTEVFKYKCIITDNKNEGVPEKDTTGFLGFPKAATNRKNKQFVTGRSQTAVSKTLA
jgi:hypothetical protein